MSWPCWYSPWPQREERIGKCLSQDQGELMGWGHLYRNPDLILLPCGEVSELQLPSTGPCLSHPPRVVSGLDLVPSENSKKIIIINKNLLLRTSAERMENRRGSGHVPNPDVFLAAGLLPHPLTLPFLRAFKETQTSVCPTVAFVPAFTELWSDLRPWKSK